MADDLVNRLSQLSNLRVLPRGDVMAAAAQAAPAATLGRHHWHRMSGPENARALGYFEQAKTMGSRVLLTMPWDPRVTALHQDPRFNAFMASIRNPT